MMETSWSVWFIFELTWIIVCFSSPSGIFSLSIENLFIFSESLYMNMYMYLFSFNLEVHELFWMILCRNLNNIMFSSYYNMLEDMRQLQITLLKLKCRKCSKVVKCENTDKGIFSLFVILLQDNNTLVTLKCLRFWYGKLF